MTWFWLSHSWAGRGSCRCHHSSGVDRRWFPATAAAGSPVLTLLTLRGSTSPASQAASHWTEVTSSSLRSNMLILRSVGTIGRTNTAPVPHREEVCLELGHCYICQLSSRKKETWHDNWNWRVIRSLLVFKTIPLQENVWYENSPTNLQINKPSNNVNADILQGSAHPLTNVS